MPQMSGLECVRKYRKHMLKNRKNSKLTPIIAFTASFSSNDEKQMLLNSGFTRVLYKPVDPKALLRTVKEFLEAS